MEFFLSSASSTINKMTSDDQFFFDYVSRYDFHPHFLSANRCSAQLASIPHDVRRYSMQVADSIDRQFDHAATVIRDTLSQQSWLPPTVRPSMRVPQSSRAPRGLTDRVQDWMVRNRAWTAAIVAFVGTGCVLLYGNKKLNGKRRKARKAGNGARKEIVGELTGLSISTWRWMTC